MTTPAVAPGPPAPTPPRTAAAGGPREDAAALGPFDRQLHAARQQRDAAGVDPSSKAPERREQAPAPRQPDAAAPAADPPAATGPRPAPASGAVAVATDAAAPAAKAPAEKDASGEPAASALAGAMLALLGPSVAGVLRPAVTGAVDVVPAGGKSVASDAGAATSLRLDAAAAVELPVTAVVAAVSGRGPLPVVDTGREPSKDAVTPIALPGQPPPAAPVVPHALQLQSPPGGPAFGQELGQHVAWLGGQDIKQARIRLHPEELGSLDVNVSVTHGRVDVVFSAQHPAAVAAVQQGLPQLDQMLARHGLSLGHAEVGQRDRGDGRRRAGHAGAGVADEIAEVHGIGPAASPGRVGLLDAFA